MIQKTNLMDKVLVVSTHSKNIFEKTVHEGYIKETNQPVILKTEVPIEPVNYPVRQFDNGAQERIFLIRLNGLLKKILIKKLA